MSGLFPKLREWLVTFFGSIHNVDFQRRGYGSKEEGRIVCDSKLGRLSTPWVSREQAEALFERITQQK